MTLESTITRELSIRFIDARKLVTAAKLNLDITSYPTAKQTEMLIQEATRIFYDEIAVDSRKAMQTNNQNLVASKSVNTAAAAAHADNDASCSSLSTFSSLTTNNTCTPASPHSSTSHVKFEQMSSPSGKGNNNKKNKKNLVSSPKTRKTRGGAKAAATNVDDYLIGALVTPTPGSSATGQVSSTSSLSSANNTTTSNNSDEFLDSSMRSNGTTNSHRSHDSLGRKLERFVLSR